MMIHLSQRDPRWAANKIGASTLTIGRYGCTLTCISMISSLLGIYMSPDQIAAHQDWFTPDGLVLWLNFRVQGIKFVRRLSVRNDAVIQAALAGPNTAVMLCVNNGTHWVVAKRKALFSNDYVIQDPWTGAECLATRVYHNIVGCAVWIKSV